MSNPSLEFPLGIYKISTDLTSLIIRAADSSTAREIGRLYRNDEFRVFQVLPVDKSGIIWGRISEAVEGNVQYVGLKVGANKKVILLKVFDGEVPSQPSQIPSMKWAQEIDLWARLNGFKGQKPGG